MTPQPLRIATITAFLAGITFLSACTKEPLSPTPSVEATTATGVKPENLIIPLVCQVTNMDGAGFYYYRPGLLSRIDYTNITYNSDALPARCKHSESQEDSVVSLFYYDASKRLKSIATYYYPKSHSIADVQTDYYSFNYQTNGTLLVNFYYVFPLNPVPQGQVSILYEFDASHRISKRSLFYGTAPVSGYLRYIYGSDGNISDVNIWTTGSTEKNYYHFNAYDSKRNFCTTNSVWQLLLEQYSLNNPTNFVIGTSLPQAQEYMAYQYNAENEPTVFWHLISDNNTWVTGSFGYSCKPIFLF